jgi:hypothetical protein
MEVHFENVKGRGLTSQQICCMVHAFSPGRTGKEHVEEEDLAGPFLRFPVLYYDCCSFGFIANSSFGVVCLKQEPTNALRCPM